MTGKREIEHTNAISESRFLDKRFVDSGQLLRPWVSVRSGYASAPHIHRDELIRQKGSLTISLLPSGSIRIYFEAMSRRSQNKRLDRLWRPSRQAVTRARAEHEQKIKGGSV